MLDTYSGATRVIFIVGDPIARVKAPKFAIAAGGQQGSADPHGFDLVINALPMGMAASDSLPVDVERLAPTAFVGDVGTKPLRPPLIVQAEARGSATMTGMGMFEAVRDCLVDFHRETP